jgi:hypothetical protein
MFTWKKERKGRTGTSENWIIGFPPWNKKIIKQWKKKGTIGDILQLLSIPRVARNQNDRTGQ